MSYGDRMPQYSQDEDSHTEYPPRQAYQPPSSPYSPRPAYSPTTSPYSSSAYPPTNSLSANTSYSPQSYPSTSPSQCQTEKKKGLFGLGGFFGGKRKRTKRKRSKRKTKRS